MKRVLLTCLLALGLASLLASCGGGDGDAPSKSEYIAQVDKICKSYNEKAANLARGASSSPTGQDFQSIFRKFVPIVDERIDKVRAVEKPEGDEERLNAIYDDAAAGNEKIKEAIRTPRGAAEIAKGGNPFEKADKAARDYGFKECGK
jgi:hypothetical protein